MWGAAFVGFWTLMALLGAAQAYVSQMIWDEPIPWQVAVIRSFKEWYGFGLMAVLVLLFCSYVNFDAKRKFRWFLIHLAAAPVFAVAYVALLSWLLAGEISMQTGEVLSFGYLFQKMAIHYVIMTFTFYWIVVYAHLGWRYYRGYQERELQTVQLQRELSEARLAALRMQLNPHFLFNTLHAVSALITTNPEAAERVVARLSDLLRSTLDSSKPQEVPLSEEIQFLEKYLLIEQARFEDRLHISTEIASDSTHALVPYLVLQPLVENAIRHGIEPMDTLGRLEIKAQRRDSILELQVIDNGKGLQLDSGVQLFEGIGLSNTRSRLRHLYGELQKFELLEQPSGGVCVRIEIPFHTVSRN